MSDRQLSPARAAHSHLFPGATLTIEDLALEPHPHATGLDLVFADDSQTVSELLVGESPTDLVLAVPAYTTSAGTTIPAKLWQVGGWTGLPDGTIQLRLGARLPLAEG